MDRFAQGSTQLALHINEGDNQSRLAAGLNFMHGIWLNQRRPTRFPLVARPASNPQPALHNHY
jgi:hypothetical protein